MSATVPRVVNHVGLTVSDVEVSAAFYRDVVGLEIVRGGSKPAGGDWFDTLTHNQGAQIISVILATEGFALQLLQYLAAGDPESTTGHNRVGNVHLCINVSDIEDRHADISATGKWDPTPIVELPIPGQLSFYVSDPDGVPVEFTQGPYVAETAGLPEE